MAAPGPGRQVDVRVELVPGAVVHSLRATIVQTVKVSCRAGQSIVQGDLQRALTRIGQAVPRGTCLAKVIWPEGLIIAKTKLLTSRNSTVRCTTTGGRYYQIYCNWTLPRAQYM
jgi:hypothetical protein